MRRRDFLIGLGALLGSHRLAIGAPERTTLAAAWQAGVGYQVGIVQQDSAGELRIVRTLDVPTRAHGLLQETGDTLLAVARRPGDWLLRWDRNGRAISWRWIEPRRAFSGHALSSADGRTVYTTEADLDTGAGLIGVRDAATLEKRAEWSTHGIDAHELIRDITGEGRLIVANGGIPTRPETGRVKRDLARMDSSLVRLDARSGEPLGQWRLNDRRLSLRHLAWGAGEAGPVLGIALQAEHDDPEARASAPALAVFDGGSLRTVVAPVPVAGYGGDIAATGRTFAVSCPRARGVALYDVNGGWRGLIALEDACALASVHGRIWAGGRHAAITWNTRDATSLHAVPAIRLDNHWIEI